MNDFTKRELEWIYEGMESIVGSDSCETERILLKIRDMIKEYCEHSETKQYSDVDYISYCAKCGSFQGWD